jgi:hypothetical protein
MRRNGRTTSGAVGLALGLATASCGVGGGGERGTAALGTLGNGTLTGATVNATIANALVYVDCSFGTPTLLIELAGSSSGPITSNGTLTFTKPANAPQTGLLSTISVLGVSPGTFTDTTPGVCGEITIGTNGEGGIDWVASAACPNLSKPIGAWTLTLSSVLPVLGQGSSTEMYLTVNGSLTATMSDGTVLGDTATLELTF